jgi:hypothetical protein
MFFWNMTPFSRVDTNVSEKYITSIYSVEAKYSQHARHKRW